MNVCIWKWTAQKNFSVQTVECGRFKTQKVHGPNASNSKDHPLSSCETKNRPHSQNRSPMISFEPSTLNLIHILKFRISIESINNESFYMSHLIWISRRDRFIKSVNCILNAAEEPIRIVYWLSNHSLRIFDRSSGIKRQILYLSDKL